MLDRHDPDGKALTGPAERDRVLRLLRRIEPDLRVHGVRHLRLFGSVARGEAGPASDVDLMAEIDHGTGKFSLLDLIRLETEIGQVIGRPVEIATAPWKMRPRTLARVERDAIEVL